MTNRVVEFEADRLVARQHRSRYELEPVAGGTRVIGTRDGTLRPLQGRFGRR